LVVDAERVIPLERDERRDGSGGRVEEPQPGGAALDERRRDASEERLHPDVHETRLPGSGAAMEVEEVAEPVLDVGGAARAHGPPLGRRALGPPPLSPELLAAPSPAGGAQ